MPVRRTITVSITSEQDDLIRACLHTGRYASTSEIVRAALRLLEREECPPRPAEGPAASAGRSVSRA